MTVVPARPTHFDTCVVVPCFNEARRLRPDAVRGYLAGDRRIALIFVDDGSTDETGSVLARICASHPARAARIRLDRNQGKAEAVRRGLRAAMALDRVRFAGYWDADLSAPLEEIDRFRSILATGPSVDVVLGIRAPGPGREIRRIWPRSLLGALFARVMSIPAGHRFRDTQCGAKLYRVTPGLRRAVAERFRSTWIFDLELLARCRAVDGRAGDRMHGVRQEPLTRWIQRGQSNVGPRAYARALAETPHVWRLLRRNRSSDAILAARPARRSAGDRGEERA